MVKPEGIRVISECFVRPRHEVEAAKQPFYLGPLDLCMLSIGPIQKGFLFAYEDDPFFQFKIDSLVERLKDSLSIALVHFYPLSGRFETVNYEQEHACLVFLDCSKGPGARLLHATYVDLTVSDILSSADVHPAVRSFFDLGERIVNYDGHTKALLCIQVTELLDGVFIGFSMNHSLVDGTSFIHFVSMLSEIFRSEFKKGESPIRISRVPLYKMYAPDGYGPIFKLPYLEPEEFIIRYDPGPLRERIFHFSPETMARLKAKANEEAGGTQVISSFMALSGLVWRSVTRARNPPGHQETSCCLVSNARFRLDPPLSNDYFGDFVGLVKVVCKVEELLSQGLGWASRLLSLEVRKNDEHEEAVKFVKMFADHPVVERPGLEHPDLYGAATSVVIGGSPRFDMYGPEFGLGRAVAVRMGYPNKANGKVTANPGQEGDGSADLEICLRPEIMNALEEDQEFMSFVSMG